MAKFLTDSPTKTSTPLNHGSGESKAPKPRVNILPPPAVTSAPSLPPPIVRNMQRHTNTPASPSVPKIYPPLEFKLLNRPQAVVTPSSPDTSYRINTPLFSGNDDYNLIGDVYSPDYSSRYTTRNRVNFQASDYSSGSRFMASNNNSYGSSLYSVAPPPQPILKKTKYAVTPRNDAPKQPGWLRTFVGQLFHSWRNTFILLLIAFIIYLCIMQLESMNQTTSTFEV